MWRLQAPAPKTAMSPSFAAVEQCQWSSTVALAIVSNSPCEAQKAQSRVEDLGLRPEDFVSFVTSGDLAKRHLQLLISEAAPARLRCLFISHEDHLQRGTWSPEELRIMGLELVASAQDADFILANGVQVCNKGTLSEQRSTFESDASWEVFGSVLQQAAELQRPLIIANPDCVVHRADGTAFNCPGCFAKKYTAFGGSRLFVFGKPGRGLPLVTSFHRAVFFVWVLSFSSGNPKQHVSDLFFFLWAGKTK
ncbi:unnamed protein product [Effrenium voratum]|uniref:Uncharacterized protein n=1 Tax=Effrenium voratum TaxID=2562239 RepID=A0AA36IW38_9DINO|nr:unnamed protein product [Effrenium voratum]